MDKGDGMQAPVANLLMVVYLVVVAFTRDRRSVHDFVVGMVVSG